MATSLAVPTQYFPPQLHYVGTIPTPVQPPRPGFTPREFVLFSELQAAQQQLTKKDRDIAKLKERIDELTRANQAWAQWIPPTYVQPVHGYPLPVRLVSFPMAQSPTSSYPPVKSTQTEKPVERKSTFPEIPPFKDKLKTNTLTQSKKRIKEFVPLQQIPEQEAIHALSAKMSQVKDKNF